MLTLDIPAALWLTSNMRLHFHAKADRTAAIRLLGRHAAATSGEQYTVASCLAAIGYPPRVHRADPANAWPAIKAGLDGAVDAGLLPDDDSEHLPVISFTRGPRTTAGYRITLTFTDQGARP